MDESKSGTMRCGFGTPSRIRRPSRNTSPSFPRGALLGPAKLKLQRPSWEISAVWPPLRNGPGDHQPLRTSVPVRSEGASASGPRG
jgi:hypothetical protein